VLINTIDINKIRRRITNMSESWLVSELVKEPETFDLRTPVGLINMLNQTLDDSTGVTEAERTTLFPIRDVEAFKLYKEQEAAIWNNSEMEFSRDKDDYESFPEELKHIVDSIFAFFSFADGRVVENIAFRMLLMSNTIEQRMFYGLQLFVEQVHSEFYSKTIDAVIPDPDKRSLLYKALDEMPIMKKKDNWMKSYMQADLGPAYIIIPYTCVEGIFFQAGFTFILWFKVIGKMDNVVFGNLQVRKDEAKHRNFGIYKYHSLPESQKISESHITAMIIEAVDLELEFTDYVIPEVIEYRSDPTREYPESILDPDHIKTYVKLTGDHLLKSLGCKPHWNIDPETLPTWIQEIAMETKNNFYEQRGSNYSQFSTSDLYLGSGSGPPESVDMYANPDEIAF